jgi:hypothetical protein
MTIGTIMSRMGIVSICASGLVLSGCLGNAEVEAFEEDLGETEQAIGTECAGVSTPTASFSHSGVGYLSPQTYTTTSCYKAVVLDVSDYQVPASGSWINVSWNDTVPVASDPDHVATCNSMYVQAELFELASNGSWIWLDSQNNQGTWKSGTCYYPMVDLFDLDLGKTYRIAATARTSNSSSAPTRKLAVATGWLH